ncbi:MAG: hypothetical protein A2W91_13385 [Bacteroidetes bacterium GWF2_38_335]|nr:MAG: hypothetical protein A2W91_13385 [Bacteroidetes bacterium GWF2_38_335]OFY77304.1 MAG: hypothetical protein A2281_15050 [Bacteroidetes bacterium RIFOXYA12_FULL_38_20]
MGKIKQFFRGVVNSYSQIFFSNKIVFSLILIGVSFFDIYSGLYGLIAVLVSNITALSLGFDLRRIASGLYGFNSLLLGLGIGIHFDPGYLSLFVLVISAIFTFFISVVLEGYLGKYNLPFLSIPFLIGIWTVSLATREFEELMISERGIFVYNELYKTGGQSLINLYEWWKEIYIPESLKSYFMSLGAIFFQPNVLAGILIALGLLIYSRIAFMLSLIGFYAAYYFYIRMGVNIEQIAYSYIGFNYILTAIALGGFFLVPNKLTFMWTILLVPVVAMITISSSYIFFKLHLPIYSLPFNALVIIFLYVLKLRMTYSNRLSEPVVQHFSPEKNLYYHRNTFSRFKNAGKYPMKLPFMGIWRVTQGHNGDNTHKSDWRHAWDFEIFDNENKQFQGEGNTVSDYYCYDKPVLAPLGGYVEEIIDEIPDNPVGEINMNNNWGNTIVIRHTDFLFSQLSHLKPGSVKIKKGEYVKQGQNIASAGNSGRSPFPHLHFQLQATPYIGSKTLEYPVSNYIVKNADTYDFQSYKNPSNGQDVTNIVPQKILGNAFKMVPGKKMIFSYKGKTIEWEIATDFYYNHYIYCALTNSYAYFYSDDDLFFFKGFKGKKSSLLYHFYLAVYKIQKGFYRNINLTDKYPVNVIGNKTILAFQDIFAPFFMFTKGVYTMTDDFIDDEMWPSMIKLRSEAALFLFGYKVKSVSYIIEIDNEGIKSITINEKNKNTLATCIRS